MKIRNGLTWMIIIILLSTLSLGCSKHAANTQLAKSAVISVGRIDEEKYVNDYLGLTLEIPSGWNVENQEELNDAQKKNNPGVMMLSMKKKVLGEENVMFTSGAELVKGSSVKTGEDYLSNVKKSLKSHKFNYRFSDSIYTEKIDGVDFSVLKMTKDEKDGEINQKMYATIIGDYTYYFSFTYTREEAALNEVIRNVKFKK